MDGFVRICVRELCNRVTLGLATLVSTAIRKDEKYGKKSSQRVLVAKEVLKHPSLAFSLAKT
eukprot:1376656-Amorphochlora_amoeboformis.AAC.1